MIKIILFLITVSTGFGQYPKLEGYQLKGFQNINLVNVLLDADSDISTFYAITDNGLIYRVQNPGFNEEIDLILNTKGTISEAFTYDSIHYLTINSKGDCFLIKTKNFLDIDTLLSESNTSINDFRIYNDSLFVLTVSNEISKIFYSSLKSKIWSELPVTKPNYDRIVKIDNYIYLYKYLDDDISLLRNINLTKEWEFIDYKNDELVMFARIKELNSILFVCGKIEFINSILTYNKDLGIPTYPRLGGSFGDAVLKDIEFGENFNFSHNRRDVYQIGLSETQGIGALFQKSVYEGNETIKNRTLFPQSSSLNRIITNDYSQNKEFIAVGDNGFVLLINRGTTPVEYDWGQQSAAGLSFYPNPTNGIINIRNASEQIVITNITGNIVKTIVGASQVDLSYLPAGVYLVRIGDKIEKLIKY